MTNQTQDQQKPEAQPVSIPSVASTPSLQKPQKKKRKPKPKVVFTAPHDSKSKQKKSDKIFFITVAVLVIMVVGIVLINLAVRKSTISKYDYNNFHFEKKGIFWETKVQRGHEIIPVPFYYHPNDLQDIGVQEGVEDIILATPQTGTVFVSIDPNLNSTVVQAGVQISRLTGERYGIFNIPTRAAIHKIPRELLLNSTNKTITANFITCMNATNSSTVIILQSGAVTNIHATNTCIIIEGPNEEELLRAAEKLDYLLLKIM